MNQVLKFLWIASVFQALVSKPLYSVIWVPDDRARDCADCKQRFTQFRRKVIVIQSNYFWWDPYSVLFWASPCKNKLLNDKVVIPSWSGSEFSCKYVVLNGTGMSAMEVKRHGWVPYGARAYALVVAHRLSRLLSSHLHFSASPIARTFHFPLPLRWLFLTR